MHLSNPWQVLNTSGMYGLTAAAVSNMEFSFSRKDKSDKWAIDLKRNHSNILRSITIPAASLQWAACGVSLEGSIGLLGLGRFILEVLE